MTITRRQLLLQAAAVLGSSASAPSIGSVLMPPDAARRPLRLLVLGGTQFLGVHIVREAMRRGHTVTLFNRGRTNAELFPELEKLRGDRDGQLDALRGREWDCVIDDSGVVARHVELSTALLAPATEQYLFISSMDAYADFRHPNNEDSPLQQPAGGTDASAADMPYGVAKAICESHVRTAYPNRAVILRPGPIVGPLDPASRIAYWLACTTRSGPMPAPGKRRDPIQCIDARDLARFALELLENRRDGIYNVASAPRQFTMGRLISACVDSSRRAQPEAAPVPVWLPRKFLESQQAATSFPLWPGNRLEPAIARVDTRRARKAGLRITSLQTTVEDTMSWLQTQPDWQQRALQAGLGPERQQALLAAWNSSRNANQG